MPNHPVKSVPSDKETVNNDKLEKLKNVFSSANNSDNSADIAAEAFIKKNN